MLWKSKSHLESFKYVFKKILNKNMDLENKLEEITIAFFILSLIFIIIAYIVFLIASFRNRNFVGIVISLFFIIVFIFLLIVFYRQLTDI